MRQLVILHGPNVSTRINFHTMSIYSAPVLPDKVFTKQWQTCRQAVQAADHGSKSTSLGQHQSHAAVQTSQPSSQSQLEL